MNSFAHHLLFADPRTWSGTSDTTDFVTLDINFGENATPGRRCGIKHEGMRFVLCSHTCMCLFLLFFFRSAKDGAPFATDGEQSAMSEGWLEWIGPIVPLIVQVSILFVGVGIIVHLRRLQRQGGAVRQEIKV
jgi:hypothetical protein